MSLKNKINTIAKKYIAIFELPLCVVLVWVGIIKFFFGDILEAIYLLVLVSTIILLSQLVEKKNEEGKVKQWILKDVKNE